MNFWDWKFRIFFDNECENEFLNFIKKLEKDEQTIYRDMYNFYMSYFSVGELINLIIETPNNACNYINKAFNNIQKIVFLPKKLKTYYLKLINKNDKLFQHKNNLLFIIEKACESKTSVDKFWNEFTNIHKKIYLIIKKEFTEFESSTIKIKQNKLNKNIKTLFFKTYETNYNNQDIINKYGKNKIKNFNIEIKNGTCYGEWWDKNLTKSTNDKLILYTKKGKINLDDFYYTIIHETYPGHGHFYNYLQNSKTYFDHGAILLIEGWATFCEWNTYPSDYIKNIKHNEMCFLKSSFDSNYKNICSKFKNIDDLIKVSQFFGFKESYYLGALIITVLINKKFKTPKKFLEFLKTKNKGDLFDLWLD